MTVNYALALLGLSHMPSTEGELRDAYVSVVRRWHPDRVASRGGNVTEASRRMSLINEANMLLTGVIKQGRQVGCDGRFGEVHGGRHYRQDEFDHAGQTGVRHGFSSLVSSLFSGMRRRNGMPSA